MATEDSSPALRRLPLPADLGGLLQAALMEDYIDVGPAEREPGREHDRAQLLQALSLVEEAGGDAEAVLRSFTSERTHWVATCRTALGWICYQRDHDDDSLDEASECFRAALILAPYLELASVGLYQSLWCSGSEQQALVELQRFARRYVSTLYPEALSEVPDWEYEIRHEHSR